MRRSWRLGLQGRWALRDARRRWLQVVSIALLLALGVGMYSSMSSMSQWRKTSAQASFQALRMHDLRMSLAEGSYARQGALSAALARIPARAEVRAAGERLVVPTQVDASAGGNEVIVPGRLVGAPVAASVDTLHTVRGRPLTAADNGRPVAMIERNFAKYHHLAASGSVRVAGGYRVRYSGQAAAPEYFVVTAPGADFGAEANFGVLFVPLRTAQVLSGERGRVNELVLRTRPGADLAAIQAQLAAAMRTELPGIGVTFTLAPQEPAWRLLFKDAEGDQRMLNVFAYLLLGAAVFAAFNLVSRTVEAQRREIGIGMALGVPPRTLAIRPLLMGAQVAVLGVVLGIPAGLAAAGWMRTVIESFFPLPVVETPLQIGYYARGAAVGLILPLLAIALPVRRALRVTPVEAITVGSRSARSSGLAWLLKGVRIPGGSMANLPLRNVLRTPRRTVLTVVGIGAVVSIVVAIGGMIDSFDTTISASRDEALAGARDRLTVDLREPQPAGGALFRSVAGAPSVGGAEESLRLPATLRSPGRDVNVYLEVVAPSGRLWHPTFRQGRLPAGRPGVAIAQRAADDLHVGVGDTIVVRHPAPTGPRSFALVDTRLPITGINASSLRFVAYANRAAAPALHVSGLANRISVVPAAGRDAAAVQRDLLRLPGIAAVQGAAAMTDAVSKAMDQFVQVLVVCVAIAVTMSLLIALNSNAINSDERAREHATMFAYGVTPLRVVRGNMAEALAIGLLATALGIGVGWLLIAWIADASLTETVPDLGTLLAVSPLTYVEAALAGTLAVALAPLFSLRRLRRADVPAELRVVE